MAPSRAPLTLLRLARAQPLRPSPSARLISSSCRISHRSVYRLPRLVNPVAQRSLVISSPTARAYSTPAAATVEPPDYLNEAELHIFNKVKAELEPVRLQVSDISGGCGSMYRLEIESAKFAGLSVIKQHKMVNAVLKEEIKGWHGVQLKTKAA